MQIHYSKLKFCNICFWALKGILRNKRNSSYELRYIKIEIVHDDTVRKLGYTELSGVKHDINQFYIWKFLLI